MTLNKFKLHSILLLCTLLFFALSIWTAVAQAENQTVPLPVFDGHIHYSHDVWDAISPQDAIRRLREVGVKRAMVSSSSDEGTQRLYQADPAFVVPSLRPYRKRGTIETWMHDETVIPYLKERLKKYRYAAIGELHIDGEQAYLPVMREIIRLAKKYQLVLHVHSDAHAIKFIFEQYPEATILWAHAGFDYAVVVGKMMDKYPNLMADLSFRGEIINDGHIMKAWNILLNHHADRFLLGIDTYEPLRWLQIKNVMRWQHELLSALPKDVARKIAYENSKRITKPFDIFHQK